MPMRKKAQAASLLAKLFERVRVQVIRKQNNGVRKPPIDKGGEFMSRNLETFCAWRGIVHTFSDTVAHQSNGVAERRIGQLTTGIRSCLLRSCLPHHLWVEAAMHVAHAQNLLPTQTLLNRESGTTSRERQYTDLEELTRLAPDIRRCIPYLLYYGDVTDDMFCLLVQQMRPFGVQVIFYPRRASLQHLEERGIMGYFMGPGDGPSMDPVYISWPTGSTVRKHRHVVTPLVCLEMHAALMHCSRLAETQLPQQVEAEHLEGDQSRLQPYERGLLEVADRYPLTRMMPSCNKSSAKQPSTMCEPHRHVRQEQPLLMLPQFRHVTVARGSIPRSASITTSQEVSVQWMACGHGTVTAIRACFAVLQRCSPPPA